MSETGEIARHVGQADADEDHVVIRKLACGARNHEFAGRVLGHQQLRFVNVKSKTPRELVSRCFTKLVKFDKAAF